MKEDIVGQYDGTGGDKLRYDGATQAIGERAAKAYGSINEEVSGFYQNGKGKVRRASHQVGGYVRQHPFYSLAAAVGAGFLVGILNLKKK